MEYNISENVIKFEREFNVNGLRKNWNDIIVFT